MHRFIATHYLVSDSSVSRGYPAAITVPRLVTISSLSDLTLTLHKAHAQHSNNLNWTASNQN